MTKPHLPTRDPHSSSSSSSAPAGGAQAPPPPRLDELEEAIRVVRRHTWHAYGDHGVLSCVEVLIDQMKELKAQRPYRVAAPPPPQDTYPWGETMPQYAVLGIGAKAWAELEDIERRGQQSRNNEHSGMMISWGTFTTLMNVLRAIRLKDFRAVAAPPPHPAPQAKDE